MASKRPQWCYECWLKPVNDGGVFCDGCEADVSDGVLMEVNGPWCAKCNLWPVAFRGDFCDDCLPGQPGKKAAKPAKRPAYTPPALPTAEQEVTYLPARRLGVPA